MVDRDPSVQQLRIILARPDAPWQVIGGSKVSTGQAGRHGYFITPVGVFLHTDGILDYRALGTFNENHIRGLGLKGMRVWDFGWQTAERGWGVDRDTVEIRLEMHATDPEYLEQRLGRPASEGCVRVPATMNRFLDVHGVLDADYERAAQEDPRFQSHPSTGPRAHTAGGQCNGCRGFIARRPIVDAAITQLCWITVARQSPGVAMARAIRQRAFEISPHR